MGRIFRPNSLGNGRPGSNEGPNPTTGFTRGLRAGGSPWLYFEGCFLLIVQFDNLHGCDSVVANLASS
jgi:hypothetical protein